MKKILPHIYHVGDNGCSVYLVDTRSDHGLVLIDSGMSIDMLRQIDNHGLSFQQIRHCILTHCHIDHINACAELAHSLPDIKFYAHELDAIAIESTGYEERTAASWYGVQYRPVRLFQQFTGDTLLKLGQTEFHCIHTPGHTPGSISILVKSNNIKVLFGQDLHGPFNEDFLSDLNDYQKSMEKLLNLDADILCEGHFGIFKPKDRVKEYILTHKNQNKP